MEFMDFLMLRSAADANLLGLSDACANAVCNCEG